MYSDWAVVAERDEGDGICIGGVSEKCKWMQSIGLKDGVTRLRVFFGRDVSQKK